MKRKIEDILKPNADWTVKKIDFDSPEVIESLRRCKEEQIKLREMKNVDWNKVLNIIVNI